MTETRTCPKCGAELPDNAPSGICPKCLIQAGLESEQNVGSASDPNPTTLTSGFVPPEPEDLAQHFPQCEILELLGKGGMGAVYKARQPGLDRLVAVKILPPEVGADPAFAERFTRESRALAKLSHQNIVSVFDSGEADGLYYFIMEYVEGATLRQVIETGAVNPEEALAIVPQICEALQFAHDEGIVHRDIKPENILIDERGRVKIADFGLAKLLGRAAADMTLTGTHQAMGTMHYMAPEQTQSAGSVDHRADIFSLGVVFYEMLTGQLPIGRFEPPSKKTQVDVRLDEVVLRSLEIQPERRYQRASDVKTDVENISRGAQAVPAPAPSRPNRLSEAETQAARDRVLPAAISLTILSGLLILFAVVINLAAIGVSVWYASSRRGPVLWNGWWFPGGEELDMWKRLMSLALIQIPLLPLELIMFVGAFRMRRLESYGMAITASYVAALLGGLDLLICGAAASLGVQGIGWAIVLLPGLGIPVGIWCLQVLHIASVRAAFTAGAPPARLVVTTLVAVLISLVGIGGAIFLVMRWSLLQS